MSEDRQWFNVGVVKLPESERDVAASVFAGHPERFYDIVGANTAENDDRFPVGSNTTYSALLTQREVDQFARASNLRYIEPNAVEYNVKLVEPRLPRPRSMRYLQGEQEAYPSLTGTGIPIAVIDEGSTGIQRAAKSITLLEKAFFLPDGEPLGEIWAADANHGCLTSGTAVPVGGTLLDAMVINEQGGVDHASVANSITWAVTEGARVVNLSLSLGSSQPAVVNDAFYAASDHDIVFICAAGNDGVRGVAYPASLSQVLNYVHSIGSIDMSRDRRSGFSNWGPWITGMAPGELVYTTNWDGTAVQWNGTSASAPHVVNLVARIMSADVSAKQAAAALKATTRDFGLGEEQGGGVYSMQAALRWLNKEPPIVITPGQTPVTPKTRGLPLW